MKPTKKDLEADNRGLFVTLDRKNKEIAELKDRIERILSAQEKESIQVIETIKTPKNVTININFGEEE